MRAYLWCTLFVVLLLIQLIYAEENEEEDSSSRSAIPTRKRGGRHRRHHVLSNHDRRALRHRYNSVLAIGVGLGVAGGWICVATLVYVVRYFRVKRREEERQERMEDEADLL